MGEKYDEVCTYYIYIYLYTVDCKFNVIVQFCRLSIGTLSTLFRTNRFVSSTGGSTHQVVDFEAQKKVPSALKLAYSSFSLVAWSLAILFPLKPQPLVLHWGCTVTYLRDKQIEMMQKTSPADPPGSPHRTMPESSHLSGSLWTLRFASLRPSNWNPASSLCIC